MASSLKEVEIQMNNCGIFLPMGIELVANNGTKYERFKPADSRWKRGKEAWYVLFENYTTQNHKLFYTGAFGIADEKYTVEKSVNSGFSVEELREVEHRWEENLKKLEQLQEEQRISCAEKAARLWDNVKTQHSVSASHPYVAKKKIKPIGAQIPSNDVLWQDRALVSLQCICEADENGGKEIKKVFLTGTPKKASFAVLGLPDEKADGIDSDIVYVCEGWATGCSIFEASKKPVVVAFDAGNIEPVINSIKRFVTGKIVIAADNDNHFAAKLREEIRAKYNSELEISASPSGPKQYVDTPAGQIEIHAYWGKKDGESCIYFNEKTPAQKKAIKRCLLNTGVFKATIAAAKHRCEFVFPQFKNPDSTGTDFNDLATEEGIGVVQEQLKKTKKVGSS
uniref:toprim domain-containing protein n=1 Tax=Turicimonas muris TaxID=1796652 RepID=UPI00248A997F